MAVDSNSRLSSVLLCWIQRERITDGDTIKGSKRQKTVCVESEGMNGAIHRGVCCLRIDTSPSDDNDENSNYSSMFIFFTWPAVILWRALISISWDKYGRNLDRICRMGLICCFVYLVQSLIITCDRVLAEETMLRLWNQTTSCESFLFVWP